MGSPRVEEETRRAREAPADSRKGQFDANRAIVVRVNRLRLVGDPPTTPAEHNSRFVSLYFIPRALGELLQRYRNPSRSCDEGSSREVRERTGLRSIRSREMRVEEATLRHQFYFVASHDL